MGVAHMLLTLYINTLLLGNMTSQQKY
jgi:hypothetical protein